MQGIFATVDDLKNLYNCSYSTAQRKYQVVKDAFGKKKHQKVTIKEMCDYLGVTHNEFTSAGVK